MSVIERCSGFLGRWVLMPGTCVYEQGEPPQDGTYLIAAKGKTLKFSAVWTDTAGEQQDVTFEGRPNGIAMPFDGGDLVDAISVELVSEQQLDTTAWRGGKAQMFAKRTLSDSGRQMTISQTVYLPGGTSPTNWSTYQRVPIS